jgi:hypothetical protein
LAGQPLWDRFNVAIHGRFSLSKAEKLAYLRKSLKDGPAKGVIEGLSESGDFYDEAIDSLKARYDHKKIPFTILSSEVGARVLLRSQPIQVVCLVVAPSARTRGTHCMLVLSSKHYHMSRR